MKITAILPMSRTKYLDRVLDSLQNQTILPNNLLIIFDGNDNEYVEARNKIIKLEGFEHRLVVLSKNLNPAQSIPERRVHITNIHNQAKELIEDCEWVFSIEDDGILPPDAVEKLIKNIKPDTGIITGVELGRWGVPYVGAWTVDDVFEPKKVSSLESKVNEGGIEKIDACGLYCALIRADLYKSHNFFTNNGLGPDVNLALYVRQQGWNNYIDWSIHVTHLTNNGGVEQEIKATDESRQINLTLLSGSTWRY